MHEQDEQTTAVEFIEPQAEVPVLDTIFVTATRQEEQSLLDVPVTVNIITREEMTERVVNNIADLVRYEPGVKVHRTTSGTDPYGNLSGFTIRGIGGNRVQIRVDGARVIEQIQDGNRDFVDLSMMEAVEIVRGPGSVLWGADALAGIVSYQTMSPNSILRGRQQGARLSFGYDSLNHGYTYTGIAAAQISPTWQGLVGYTYRTYSEAEYSNARADGGSWGCSRIGMGCDRLNPLDGNANNLLTKLVWSPNTSHQVRFTGEYFRSDADVDQLYDRYQVSAGLLNSGDYLRNQVQTRWRLGIEHEWLVDAGWVDEVRWMLSYSPQKRALTDQRFQTRVANRHLIETNQNTDYSETFTQADIQLTSRFGVGLTEHQLTYGFQGDITKTEYDRQTITSDLNSGVTTVARGGGTNFSNAETTRYDFFIQDEIRFFDGKISLTPGLRWANYRIKPEVDADYKVILGSEPRNIDSHKLIPQLSALYRLDETYSFYVRYAEGFKMPTVQQLYTSSPMAMGLYNIVPNPDLKPETVRSYEIGARAESGSSWGSISVYYNDYEDFIKSQVHVAGTANDYTSTNVSEVKILGLEVSAGYSFSPSWHVSGGFTYQYGKERNDGDDRYTPFRDASPVNGFLGIKWQNLEQNLDVEILGNFSGAVTRTSSDSNYKPAGYATYDGYLNWNIYKGLKLSFAVRNIFDKRYFISAASTMNRVPSSAAMNRTTPLELFTGPGRSFAVNLQLDF